jgi:hypothetical protein
MMSRAAQLIAERAEFMAALDAHEDAIEKQAFHGSRDASALTEARRMSRRVVVAAFDHASLRTEPVKAGDLTGIDPITRKEPDGAPAERAASGAALGSAVDSSP